MEIRPAQKEFNALAKKHNLIVLSHKFYSDVLTPVSIYQTLSKVLKGESFLLESVEGEEKINRFSFLGFSPLVTFKSKGKSIYISGEEAFETARDPLTELQRVMKRYQVAPIENLRFFGGFVGYLGFDVVGFYEPVTQTKSDPLDTYDAYFVLPEFLIVFDHLKRQIEILAFVTIDRKTPIATLYKNAAKSLKKIFDRLQKPAPLCQLDISRKVALKLHSNITKKNFVKMIQRAKNYIRQGEIIQVVPSQRFSMKFSGDPFTAYRYLRLLNPSPYMFYLNFADTKIAGSSPEMLVRCEKNEITTRPIAGTRARGKDESQDKRNSASLLADPKEIAEHIMLVDLARNDLGRVATHASVHVPIFMSVERFSHVMHIVSEVRAQVRPQENIFSVLRSSFPAGTVSGAPKVRAMQIISELEPHARGIYAGCVGYFSFTKSLDTCIIIRTVLFKGHKASIQAGAGIVYDSIPVKEYTETVNKAKAQMIAVALADKSV